MSANRLIAFQRVSEIMRRVAGFTVDPEENADDPTVETIAVRGGVVYYNRHWVACQENDTLATEVLTAVKHAGSERETLFKDLQAEVGYALPRGVALDVFYATLRLLDRAGPDGRKDATDQGKRVILTGTLTYPGSRVSDVRVDGAVGTIKVGEGFALQVENRHVKTTEG